jgi:hypothetical protein
MYWLLYGEVNYLRSDPRILVNGSAAAHDFGGNMGTVVGGSSVIAV